MKRLLSAALALALCAGAVGCYRPYYPAAPYRHPYVVPHPYPYHPHYPGPWYPPYRPY